MFFFSDTLSDKSPKIIEEDESVSDVEEVDSDEWDEMSENPIDNNNCLFCSHHSGNFYKNLEHMTISHSFFIPDIEYCTDVEGLLRYLGEKVSEGKYYFIKTIHIYTVPCRNMQNLIKYNFSRKINSL